MTVVEFTATPGPARFAEAPGTKPAPSIVTSWFVAPWPRADGNMAVTVGAGVTSKQSPQTAGGLPFGSVTVTSRSPVAAALEIVTLARRCCASTHVVEFTVTPLPKTDQAPGVKPDPTMVM